MPMGMAPTPLLIATTMMPPFILAPPRLSVMALIKTVMDSQLPLDGTESYLYTEVGQSNPGVVPCELYWTTSSTTALTDCTDCLFAFTIDFTFDSTNSVIDSTSSDCLSYAADYSYDYGYVEDYDGAGTGAILSRNTGTTTWEEWFSEGDLYGGTPATIVLTGDQFTYTIGYEDYTYQGYYFTNAITGAVTVQ